MFNLTSEQETYLLNQPESGMGYQFVDVVTDSNRQVTAIAYNAEIVLALDDPDHRKLFSTYAFGARLEGAGTRLRAIKVLGRAELRRRSFFVAETASAYGATKKGPAKDAPVVATNAGDTFKRFTAYANDRRIRPDRSLMPGTYATTEEDARHVHTGKEAVARYALPNPTPAVHVFTIVPLTSTAIQYGVVEPANGQPGGGVEVIFTTGTTAATVFDPVQIPPE